MKVYLDYCTVIYAFLENSGHLNHLVIENLEQFREEGFGIALVTWWNWSVWCVPCEQAIFSRFRYSRNFSEKKAILGAK